MTDTAITPQDTEQEAADTEAATKRNEARNFKLAGIVRLLQEKGIEEWIRIRASLKYSVGNQLLILGQRPDLTYPACRTDWQKYGRTINNGAVPIAIWNRPFPVRGADGKPKLTQSGKPQVVFTVAGIFDQADTTVVNDKLWAKYEPLLWKKVKRTTLPDSYSQPITGDSHAACIPALVALAESEGWTVSFEDMGEQYGGSANQGTKEIKINTNPNGVGGSAPNAHVGHLVHEIAHALGGVTYTKYGRVEAEGMAEVTAWHACSTVGLDRSGFSDSYIAGWLSAVHAHAGDTAKRIGNQCKAIDGLAKKIEDVMIDAMGIRPERIKPEATPAKKPAKPRAKKPATAKPKVKAPTKAATKATKVAA